MLVEFVCVLACVCRQPSKHLLHEAFILRRLRVAVNQHGSKSKRLQHEVSFLRCLRIAVNHLQSSECRLGIRTVVLYTRIFWLRGKSAHLVDLINIVGALRTNGPQQQQQQL